MSTEKLLFCTFPLLLLVVAFLAWSWIDPPKAAKYGTYISSVSMAQPRN